MGTARGLLMLSPRPRLIPTSCTDMVLVTLDTMVLDTSDTDTDSDMDTDSDTAMDSYTARGLLMLSLRLRLILTTMVLDTDWDTPDISDMPDSDISDMDTEDTSTESRLHEELSVNQLGQKWSVISLNFPSPVLQFQCYHTKSLVMVSRKQENQSGKNPANIKIIKIKR